MHPPESLEPRRLLAAVTDVLVPAGSSWRYLDTGADPGPAWTAPTFPDSAWRSGPAQLGYGDGDEATVVASGPSTNRFITTYFRRTFTATEIRRYTAASLEIKRDDGAIVYLNGSEIARSNMPAGPVNSLTRATLNIAGADETTFYPFSVPPSLLSEGSNTLAVEVHQNLPTSGDISFDLRLSAAREEFDNNPFTIVVLPDTQFYSQSYPETFHAQTQWIVDNAQSQNIKFVTHVGDVIQWVSDPAFRLTEWQRADAAMDRLDTLPALPYSVTVGNHDYEVKDSHLSGAARFVEYFGAARYAGRPWYGGATADQRNHYQIFSAARWSFLHITVEFEASDAALAWAQSVVNAHPGLPTILTTHAYVQGTSGRATSFRNTDGNSGERIWQEFVRVNPSVFMVLNGHYPGEATQTSTNDAGKPVFEMLADYQSRTEGGQGFLRLLRFVPLENRIDVQTWSPTRNVFETDANSQFSLPINFDQRFGTVPVPPPPPPPQVQTLTFQQGVNNYAAARDTRLHQAVDGSSGPTTNLATSSSLDIDDDTPAGSGADTQSLLRFDNLFANAAGPIPLGSAITSATLTFNVTNAGSGLRLHRMLSPWSDTATWSSLTNGVQPDGIESTTTPDASLGAPNSTANIPTGVLTIDVTNSLRAWSAGATNQGWALLPLPAGSNGITLTSSEGATLSQRPKLTVTFTPPAQGAAPTVQMLSTTDTPSTNEPVPVLRPMTLSNRLALGESLRTRRRTEPLQSLLV